MENSKSSEFPNDAQPQAMLIGGAFASVAMKEKSQATRYLTKSEKKKRNRMQRMCT